jgi:hypothetical protein
MGVFLHRERREHKEEPPGCWPGWSRDDPVPGKTKKPSHAKIAEAAKGGGETFYGQDLDYWIEPFTIPENTRKHRKEPGAVSRQDRRGAKGGIVHTGGTESTEKNWEPSHAKIAEAPRGILSPQKAQRAQRRTGSLLAQRTPGGGQLTRRIKI